MPQLICHVTRDYPQIHDLLDDRITVGRSIENKISLLESNVSVHHAELFKEKDGSYRVKDLGSSNGTYVNNVKVIGHVLKDGDRVKFGAVKAVYVEQEGNPDRKQGALDKDIESKAAKLAQLEKTIKITTKQLGTIQEGKSSDLKEQSQNEQKNLNSILIEVKSAQQMLKNIQSSIKDEESTLQALQNEGAGLKNETQQIQSEHKGQLKQKKDLDVELARLAKEVEKAEAVLEKKKKASKEMTAFVKNSKAIEDKMGELDAELKTKETAFEELSKKVTDGEKAHAELSDKISEREKALEELNRKITEREKAHEELGKKISDREETHAELGKTVAAREKSHAELGKQIAAREEALGSLGKKVAEREQAFEEIGKEIDERSSSLAELDNSVKAKQKQATDLAEKVKKNDESIRGFSGKVKAMEASLAQGLATLAKSEEKEKSLKKENETLSQLVGQKSTVLQQVKAKIFARQHGKEESICPPLRVIQPGTRFLMHFFHHGPGEPGAERVDPAGYYGLAACTKGSVHREFDTIPQGDDPVLLLLPGEPDKDKELIQSVAHEMPSRILLVCWREGLLDASTMKNKAGLLKRVSGIVSVDTRTADLVDELEFGRPHLRIPLPCPVDYPVWQMPEQKSKRPPKILVSTDGFDPNSSIHKNRLELINKLVADTPISVTLYQSESKQVPGLKVPENRLSKPPADLGYSEYLAFVAAHPFVTSLGNDIDGGANIGDAVLAQSIFVGGDFKNSVDELLFPECCIKDGNIDPVVKKVTRLLSDHAAYHEIVEQAQLLAPQLISFETVSDRINEFIQFISENSTGV